MKHYITEKTTRAARRPNAPHRAARNKTGSKAIRPSGILSQLELRSIVIGMVG